MPDLYVAGQLDRLVIVNKTEGILEQARSRLDRHYPGTGSRDVIVVRTSSPVNSER